MITTRYNLCRWSPLILGLLIGTGEGAVDSFTPRPADELLQKVIERAKQSRKAPPSYEFTRTKTTTEYHSHHEIISQEEKVYRTALKNGKLRSELVKKDGQAPPDRGTKVEPVEGKSRRASSERDRQSANDSILNQINDDMVKRFEFTITNREMIHGRATLVIDVKPRKTLKIRTTEEQIMARMAGRVWVDELEYEVVQTHVNLQETLKIGWGGMLGVLREFRFSMLRSRMPDGGWINSKIDLWFNFRQLFTAKRIAVSEIVTDVVPIQPPSPP